MNGQKSALVSVIVPIYNAEQYLRACIDSILAQTYQNLQILLIDDGSTDRSGQICDEYRSMDSRIQVIHKENGGEASARNAGLAAATGTYIGFVDSDDTVSPEMFEKLASAAADGDKEIVICGHYYREPDGWVHAADKPPKVGKLNREEALFFLLQGGSYEGYVWNKLFKKELFKSVLFDTTVFYCPDLLAVCQLMLQASHIEYISDSLYNYNIRDNSLTGRFTEKRLTEFIAREKIISLMREAGNLRLTEYARACYCKAAIYQLRCAARAGNRDCLRTLRGYAKTYWADYWTNQDITARDKLKSAVIWCMPRVSDQLWRFLKPQLKATYNRQADWTGEQQNAR